MHNYARSEGLSILGDEREVLTTKIPAEVQDDFVEFETLERDRRELFARLKKETMDLAPEVRQVLVTRVIEHSPKDGVELATQLGLSPAEIVKSLAGKISRKKNLKLAEYLNRLWSRDFSHIDLDMTEKVNILNMTFREVQSSDFDLENKWAEKFPAQVKALAETVDNYYAQFLARRKLTQLNEEKQIKTNEPLVPSVVKRDRSSEPTKTEKSGERVLNWLYDAKQGQYFSEPVRQALWQKMFGDEEYEAEKLEKAIKKLKLNESVAREIMHEPLVPRSAITVVLLAYDNPKITGSDRSRLIRKADAGDPEVLNSVNNFLSGLGASAEWKPYSMMVKSEAGHARSGLNKELNTTLHQRYGEGVKIAQNTETGKYELKDDRTEAETRPEQKEYRWEDFTVLTGSIDNGDGKILWKFRRPYLDNVVVVGYEGHFACLFKDEDIESYSVEGEDLHLKIIDTKTGKNREINPFWKKLPRKNEFLPLSQEIAEHEKAQGIKPEQKPEVTPEWAEKEFEPFLRQTFKEWWGANEADAKIQARISVLDTMDLQGLSSRKPNRQEFGEFFVNPKTQNLDWKALNDKIFVPDLSALNGKPLYEVARYLIDTYSATYHIPGLEYWKWLKENPAQSPLNLKDGDYYFVFGSVVCGNGGYWEVPIARWEGSDWDLYGDMLDRVWNSSDRAVLLEKSAIEKKREEVVLTEQEQRDLELLNLLAEVQAGKFDDFATFDYFRKYYPTDKKMSLQDQMLNFVAHSKKMVQTLNQTLAKDPKLFLSTMGAKQDNLSEAYVEHLLLSLFPEIRLNREKAERAEKEKRGRFGWGSRFGREDMAEIEADPENIARSFLAGDEYTAFEGADPKNGKETEVVRLRESTSGLLVSGVYGRYNSSSCKWEKIPLDLNKEDSGVTREITMEISDTRGLREVVLPRLSNGRILPDRIKGVGGGGQEIILKMKLNNFGENVVEVPFGVKKILYSQTEDLVPKVPTDCGAEEYEKFTRQVKRAGGEVLTEKLARLPDDVRMFIDSLRSRSPKEQVQAVEAFVRRYGYYDFDNGEVVKEKQGKNIEEILFIMEIRLQELRRRPELRSFLYNKKYAGVCADFAILASAMMRELGLPSGVISGFHVSSGQKSVTTKDAHGIAFALWPSTSGKTEIIEVDGTPQGVTAEEEALLASFRKPSLLEKEQQVGRMDKEIFEASESKLQEFEKVLAENDLEKIASLSNGTLEKVLNVLLSRIREPHYHIIKTVLEAGRYAGFDVEKLNKDNDLEAKLAFQRFLEGEITRERQKTENLSSENKFSRGSELLGLVQDFAARYEKNNESRVSRFEAFEMIKSIIVKAREKLDPLESRAVIAIIQYLEALKL